MNRSFFKQAIWVLLSFSLFLSCESEVPDGIFFLNTEAVPGLSPLHGVDNKFFGCESPLYPADTSARYCAIMRGETFRLSDSAKYWLPQYAFDIGKVFTYINENGDKLDLKLTDKKHLLVDRVITKNTDPCDSFMGKWIGTCNEVELFYVLLETESKDVSMYVEVGTTQLGNSDTTYAPMGQIWLSPLHWENPISQWIWPEELDETGFIYQLFTVDEELTLLGQTFNNVLNRNDWYYSRETGLVAFRDENEVFWVLQE